jgi:hypothetical protein
MKNIKLISSFGCLILIIMAMTLSACSSPQSSTPASSIPGTPTSQSPRPGGGGAVINSDSIITAKIVAIRQLTTGYPWEMDVLVQTSVDVGNLPNPTKDKIGQVITVKTDDKLDSFKAGQIISAKVKYVGDVPLPGITLYIYNIQLATY